MEDIADENEFTIEGDDDSASTKDGGKGVIAHAHSEVGSRSVRDEGGLVWHHVVGGACICYN